MTHLILGGQHHPDTGMSGAGQKNLRYFRVDLIQIHGYCAAIVHTQFAMESGEVVVRWAVEEMGVQEAQIVQKGEPNNLDMGHQWSSKQCCMDTVP